MIRFLALALVLAAAVHPTGCSAAAEPAELAARAEKEYRQARYGAAIALYDSLLRMGYADARIYYNLGNAHFKRGELARSRLNYERALRLDPGDPDTRRNIDLIVSRLTDRVEPVPQFVLYRWWRGMKNSSTPRGILLWGALFFSATLSLAVLFVWWPLLWVRRVLFAAMAALTLAWLSSLILLFDRFDDDAARPAAIVVAGSVTAKSSPDRSGIDSFTIHEGLHVEVRDEHAQWLQVRLPDGKLGWLPNSAVERI